MRFVKKPWGREIWWAHAKGKYMGKVLEIKKGHNLSLQYHRQKDESIYVLEGVLRLMYSDSTKDGEIRERDMEAGDSFRIRPMTLHRFTAPHGDVKLMEVSTDYPDDIVRICDDYGRTDDENSE